MHIRGLSAVICQFYFHKWWAKCPKMLFFFKKIWSIQKFVVPLHPLLKKGRESVAQQVEHIPFKDGVLGSSPSWFTRKRVSTLFFVFCSPFSFFQIARYNFACKITTKNPNVQIKFILFCSLPDYTAFFVGASIQSRDHIETTSRPV